MNLNVFEVKRHHSYKKCKCRLVKTLTISISTVLWLHNNIVCWVSNEKNGHHC